MNFTRQLKGRRDSKYLGGRPDKKAIVQEGAKRNLGERKPIVKETQVYHVQQFQNIGMLKQTSKNYSNRF